MKSKDLLHALVLLLIYGSALVFTACTKNDNENELPPDPSTNSVGNVADNPWEYNILFDACEWLAAMCSHIPSRGEQMVRYYGYYSNVCRGRRQKEKIDDTIHCIIKSDAASPARRRSWERLIQKIYEVDPLTCPQCKAAMKIISFIDQPEVVKQIL